MQCRRCGKDMGNSSRCSFCGFDNLEDGNVREMSPVEKNFYPGVTIDAGEETDSHGKKNFHSGGIFIHVGGRGFFSRLLEKFIGGLLGGNILAKIIAALIFVAFAALMFFVALPVMFFMIALGIALFLYAKVRNKF